MQMKCTNPRFLAMRTEGTGYSVLSPPLDWKNQQATGGLRMYAVPCRNNCGPCIAKKKSEIAKRGAWERQYWQNACVVMLSFRPEDLPGGLDNSMEGGGWLLMRRPFQNFAKRLRARLEANKIETADLDSAPSQRGKIRMLYAGEYGPKTLRPHFHAVIYGLDWNKNQPLFDKNGTQRTDNDGNKLWGNFELEELWGHGYVQTDSASQANISYVAQYVAKKHHAPTVRWTTPKQLREWRNNMERLSRLKPPRPNQWKRNPARAQLRQDRIDRGRRCLSYFPSPKDVTELANKARADWKEKTDEPWDGRIYFPEFAQSPGGRGPGGLGKRYILDHLDDMLSKHQLAGFGMKGGEPLTRYAKDLLKQDSPEVSEALAHRALDNIWDLYDPSGRSPLPDGLRWHEDGYPELDPARVETLQQVADSKIKNRLTARFLKGNEGNG